MGLGAGRRVLGDGRWTLLAHLSRHILTARSIHIQKTQSYILVQNTTAEEGEDDGDADADIQPPARSSKKLGTSP